MTGFCKLLCLLCSSLLGYPMGRNNIAWTNAKETLFKDEWAGIKNDQVDEQPTGIDEQTVFDLVCGGSPVFLPELHRNGALKKRLLHPFLMALHHYAY